MRHDTTRTLSVMALLAGSALATGCSDFEPEEIVVDLRPIAVQTVPPEVFVLVADGADEGLVLKVTADPAPVQVNYLVVNPEDMTTPMQIEVIACLTTDSRRCDEPGNAVTKVASLTSPPGTFSLTFTPTAAQLNTWLGEDSFQGFGGLFVTLEAIIVQPGYPTEHVAKVVTYNVPFVPQGEGQDPPPPKLPNQNPTLDGVRFGEALSIMDGEVIELPAGREVPMEPLFDRETIEESYPVPTFPTSADETPGYRILDETFEVQFWVTEGAELGASELDSDTPLGPVTDFETSIVPPATPGEEATLYIAIRDDRGGGSFYTRIIRAQ